jgi:hypothetical protein
MYHLLFFISKLLFWGQNFQQFNPTRRQSLWDFGPTRKRISPAKKHTKEHTSENAREHDQTDRDGTHEQHVHHRHVAERFHFSLLRRVRELGLGIPGLIAWQLIEAGQLWRGR